MNIYASSGDKVRFIGASEDQVRFGSGDDPRGLLKKGEVYTVDHTDVHSWHTNVYLQGIEGAFTSVAFEDVVADSAAPVES